jgi:beta-phosphoglucomutase-like phosphatase (HAD superfamily)
LDGTLIDSVYQHVLAWREALEKTGIQLSVWRIHRRVGMSGGLFVNALLRETGHQLTKQETVDLQRLHADAYARLVAQVRPPARRPRASTTSKERVRWAVATKRGMESAAPALKILGVDPNKVTVITRDQVRYAKPDPDLSGGGEETGSRHVRVGSGRRQRLGPAGCRRANALSVGLLSRRTREELEKPAPTAFTGP